MTVQPEGIPLSPVDQSFIDEALVKVPEDETPFNQSSVQLGTGILVAKHVTLLRFSQ